MSCPDWCGSAEWASSCKPKGHQFDSQSEYLPGVQARSQVGGMWEETNQSFFPSFSPSLGVGEGGRKRGRETSMCGCLSNSSYWEPGPGTCPDWESNQQPFVLQAGIQSTESHQPGGKKKEILKNKEKNVCPKGMWPGVGHFCSLCLCQFSWKSSLHVVAFSFLSHKQHQQVSQLKGEL